VLVGPEKVPTNWRLRWGNEDQATIADLSKPSIDLSEEYLRERDLVEERLFLSCFCKTKQGVFEIKEWQPPSTIDTLKEMQSLGNLSNDLSDFVSYYLKSLIDKEDSSDSIRVYLESVTKPIDDIINPCKKLPNCDVVGQETSRPSLAEIVDLKSSNKSIEATSSTSTLGGQQNKGIGADCAVTGLTGARTGLTGAQTGLTRGQPGLTGGATRSNRLI
jgi:hypothetical protein